MLDAKMSDSCVLRIPIQLSSDFLLHRNDFHVHDSEITRIASKRKKMTYLLPHVVATQIV